MTTGTETTLLSSLGRPHISPDGQTVIYSDAFGAGRSLSMIPSSGGESIKLLDFAGSGSAYAWAPDGQKFIYWEGSPIRFSWIDLATRKTSVLLAHPKRNIHALRISPDMRWVVFHTPEVRGGVLRVAPLRDGQAGGESEWITIFDRKITPNFPWWSHDGRIIYFLENLDGFECIHGQRVDEGTKRPVGEPFAIRHLHGRVRPIGVAGLSPVRDHVYVTLGESFGNIWIAESAR